MTVRLLRLAHREVVRPLLKAKHGALRSVLGARPGAERSDRTSGSTTPRPTGAASTSVVTARISPAQEQAPIETKASATTKAPAKTKASATSKTPAKTKAPAETKTPTKAKAPTGAGAPSVDASMTRAELYEEATRRDIAGRSKMTKAELLKALGTA